MRDFTFIVITYNHEEFILEHLESIKFLISHYGHGINFTIIVADDASKDNTVKLGVDWLNYNADLFANVSVLSQKINKGTCKNLISAINKTSTRFCKITAGDDIYSFENLFECVNFDKKFGLISGFPLILKNEKLIEKKINTFLMVATQIIYESRSLITRFKHFSLNNAPNIFYNANNSLIDHQNILRIAKHLLGKAQAPHI